MNNPGHTRLIGIDMAWVPEKNGSGIAAGSISDSCLVVDDVRSGIIGFANVAKYVEDAHDVQGIAVDAPLIIRNQFGRRRCESELSAAYGSRWASTHSSNLDKFPDAAPVRLGDLLTRLGHLHLGQPGRARWQVECYPHPAIIEVFGLEKRLAYKKGTVAERRIGQAKLAGLIKRLKSDPVLPLSVSAAHQDVLDESRITELTGAELKTNEDGLDAIVCLYIAGLYAVGTSMQIFGDVDDGYIVVPAPR